MTNEVAGQGNLFSPDTDYLVFSVKDSLLALPYFDIIQIVDSPTCTSVPNMPKYLRGVIDLMDEALPLFDTRIRLSIQSRQEEVADFVDSFMMRKQDHLNWIKRLKNQVENGEEISVEKNPQNCTFGRWYASYKPNTLALATYMTRFIAPHKAIHKLAVQADELIQEGRKEAARLLIHAAENKELIELLKLFDGFEEQMRQSYQEYAVVVVCNRQKYSLTVDSIKYFEKLDEITKLPSSVNIDERMISGIGRKKMGDTIEDIIILNLPRFLDLES